MSIFARLERDFGRVLGMTPRPLDPANDSPVEGLPEVTEHLNVDKIKTGNSDIPTPEWEPPTGEPERPTLPGHEHQHDPGSHVDLERRVMAMFDDIDAQIARIAAQMRADGLFRDPRSHTRLGEAA